MGTRALALILFLASFSIEAATGLVRYFETIADMAAQNNVGNYNLFVVSGTAAVDDGLGGIYSYVSTSSETADGDEVVTPDTLPGRFVLVDRNRIFAAQSTPKFVGTLAALANSNFATNAVAMVTVTNDPPVLGDPVLGNYLLTRPSIINTNAEDPNDLIQSTVDTTVVWHLADSVDQSEEITFQNLNDVSVVGGEGDSFVWDGTNSLLSVRDVFNVELYGADGWDTDNDSEAIQAAIDAAYTAGGGTVYFPYGTNYLIDTTLDLKPGVILMGNAPAGPSRIYNSDVDVQRQSTAKLRAITNLNAPMITNDWSLGFVRFPNTSTPDGEFHTKTAHKGGIVNLILDGNKGIARRENNDYRTPAVVIRNGAWFLIDGVGFHNIAGRALLARSFNFGILRDSVGQIWDQGGIVLDDCADWLIADNSMGGALGPTLWLNSSGAWKNTITGGQYWNARYDDEDADGDGLWVATIDTAADQELFTTTANHPWQTGDMLMFRDGTLNVTDLNSTTLTLDLSATISIDAAGTVYTNSDIVNLDGGTPVHTNFIARLRVSAVDGGGGVTNIAHHIGGDYTAVPGDPVATTAETGSGTGLTLTNLTWSVYGLSKWAPAYVIRESTNTFKLARGYAQALAGLSLNFTNLPSGNVLVLNGDPSNILLTDNAEMNSFTGLRTDQAAEHGIALRRASRNTFDSIVAMEEGWDNASFNAAGIAFLDGASRNQAHGFTVKSQEYGVLIDAFTDRQQVGGFTGEADTMYSIDINDALLAQSLNLIDGRDQFLWVYPDQMTVYNGTASITEISGAYPMMYFPDDGSLPGVYFDVSFPRKWKTVQMVLWWVPNGTSTGAVTWTRFYTSLGDGDLITAADTSDSITPEALGIQYQVNTDGWGTLVQLDPTKPLTRFRIRRGSGDANTDGVWIHRVMFRVRDTNN